MKEIFDPGRLLMNDLPYNFLLEVAFKSLVMYLVTVVIIKLAGRRGIQQLSIFELVIIITLGSAAGDPSFYHDVGLLPAITVFIVILSLYRLTTYFISKNKEFETWMEGKPIYLIENGEFAIDNFKKEALALDEFFAELRVRNVDHLGQVKLAILETNGQVSIFFYPDNEVKFGLPILPNQFYERIKILLPDKKYACRFCANIQSVSKEALDVTCHKCGKSEWAMACCRSRIT